MTKASPESIFDKLNMPPISKLLGWRLIELTPEEGTIRVGFDGKPEFCNPAGFIQGGMLVSWIRNSLHCRCESVERIF